MSRPCPGFPQSNSPPRRAVLPQLNVDEVTSQLRSMTERTQGDQPASADSLGEVPSKKDSLQTRRTVRRVGIEVQNVTDHLQCLSIASPSIDMELFPDEDAAEPEKVNGNEDSGKGLLGATSADFLGVGSKETLQSGFSGV